MHERANERASERASEQHAGFDSSSHIDASLIFSFSLRRRSGDTATMPLPLTVPRTLVPLFLSEASRNHEGEKASPRGYAPAMLQKACIGEGDDGRRYSR